MSYDINIGELDINYTYNVAKLFHDHIIVETNGDQTSSPTGLQALNTMTGKEAAPILVDAWERISETHRRCKYDAQMGITYDAPNGWGSLVGALIVLGQITAACAARPDEIIHIS